MDFDASGGQNKEKETQALLGKAAKKKAKKEAKEAAVIKIGLVIVVAEKAAEARKKERDAAYVAAKADAAKKRAVAIRLVEKIRLKKVSKVSGPSGTRGLSR